MILFLFLVDFLIIKITLMGYDNQNKSIFEIPLNKYIFYTIIINVIILFIHYLTIIFIYNNHKCNNLFYSLLDNIRLSIILLSRNWL